MILIVFKCLLISWVCSISRAVASMDEFYVGDYTGVQRDWNDEFQVRKNDLKLETEKINSAFG
jgi:hypothetical protein